jgi:hypothetical protein
LLNHHVILDFKNHYGNNFTIIQDNDSKHCSKLCINALKKKRIRWVTRDINPLGSSPRDIHKDTCGIRNGIPRRSLWEYREPATTRDSQKIP